MRWKTKSFTDLSGYSFTYDGVNRLKTTDYSLNGTWGKTDNTETNFRYDANGNITYMERYAANATKIDALTYNYKSGSNQIDYITDASNNTLGYNATTSAAGNYTYDANGNMTKDIIKGIKNGITYNYLNLPALVDLQTGQKITYLYTATGVKLRKTVENGTQQNDKSFDYVGNFVYDLNGTLKYIMFDEGRINVQTDGTYQYEYFLKDHLGNTRATFAVISNAVVEQQENAYYPFGMNISQLAYNATTTNVVNKYLYNGKEMQDDFGLDWNDYGARMYDAVVGRWWSVDPLAEKYRRWSPYNYCMNDPIRFIDPDGMIPWPIAEFFKGYKRDKKNNWHEVRWYERSKKYNRHQGIDINYYGAGEMDKGAPVYATHDGIVTKKRVNGNNDGGYGNSLEITSIKGTIKTHYAHLKEEPDFKPGQKIKEGQLIGYMGGTGNGGNNKKEGGYASHLHYELYKNGEKESSNPVEPNGELIDPQLLLLDEEKFSESNPVPIFLDVHEERDNTSVEKKISLWLEKYFEEKLKKYNDKDLK